MLQLDTNTKQTDIIYHFFLSFSWGQEILRFAETNTFFHRFLWKIFLANFRIVQIYEIFYSYTDKESKNAKDGISTLYLFKVEKGKTGLGKSLPTQGNLWHDLTHNKYNPSECVF